MIPASQRKLTIRTNKPDFKIVSNPLVAYLRTLRQSKAIVQAKAQDGGGGHSRCSYI